MIEVEIDSIRISLMSQQRIIVLKDLHSERLLPIFIGQPEADAITLELQEMLHERPLTHDLMKAVIENLNGSLAYVLINDLRKDIFYARLVIEVNGKQIEVDSRPSDAIALAVRTKSPIFVNESVMDKSAYEPEDDINMEQPEEEKPRAVAPTGKKATNRPQQQEETPAEAVDESQLSAFADFLNSLDMDDLEDQDKSQG